jgi:cytochrome c oxidase subunit III
MRTGLSNGRLGMMLLLGTETLLFATFICAYIVLRGAAFAWPPVGTPRLTLDLSSVNTAILVASSIFVWRRWMKATLFSGALFLVLQGVEFERLYDLGLTLKTGSYGALFYTLITCHGLHVLGGLSILAVALRKKPWEEYAEIYWHFVTAVWLILFTMLYIL